MQNSDQEMSPPRLAFLLANWYSGATLLTLILDRHASIMSNGEAFYQIGQVGTVRCSCGQSVSNCRFYQTAARHMCVDRDLDPECFVVVPTFSRLMPLQKLFSTTLLPGAWRGAVLRRLPWSRKSYLDFLHAHYRFMREATQFSSAEIYLDATKSLRRAEMLIAESTSDTVPIILLVRDPLSWCASWLHQRPEASVKNAIRTWKEYIKRAQMLSARFPKAHIETVRYEAFCMDPQTELVRIEKALGVHHDRNVFGSQTQHEHHILGNNMRFSFDGTIRAPNDRSGELSLNQQMTIRRSCRELMLELGY